MTSAASLRDPRPRCSTITGIVARAVVVLGELLGGVTSAHERRRSDMRGCRVLRWPGLGSSGRCDLVGPQALHLNGSRLPWLRLSSCWGRVALSLRRLWRRPRGRGQETAVGRSFVERHDRAQSLSLLAAGARQLHRAPCSRPKSAHLSPDRGRSVVPAAPIRRWRSFCILRPRHIEIS